MIAFSEISSFEVSSQRRYTCLISKYIALSRQPCTINHSKVFKAEIGHCLTPIISCITVPMAILIDYFLGTGVLVI